MIYCFDNEKEIWISIDTAIIWCEISFEFGNINVIQYFFFIRDKPQLYIKTHFFIVQRK